MQIAGGFNRNMVCTERWYSASAVLSRSGETCYSLGSPILQTRNTQASKQLTKICNVANRQMVLGVDELFSCRSNTVLVIASTRLLRITHIQQGPLTITDSLASVLGCTVVAVVSCVAAIHDLYCRLSVIG